MVIRQSDAICISVLVVVIPALIISMVETNRIDTQTQIDEANYMQEHYGYKDNMADYLDYLKGHDIDAYMKLKPIYDAMHPSNGNWWSVSVGASLGILFASLIICINRT